MECARSNYAPNTAAHFQVPNRGNMLFLGYTRYRIRLFFASPVSSGRGPGGGGPG